MRKVSRVIGRVCLWASGGRGSGPAVACAILRSNPAEPGTGLQLTAMDFLEKTVVGGSSGSKAETECFLDLSLIGIMSSGPRL